MKYITEKVSNAASVSIIVHSNYATINWRTLYMLHCTLQYSACASQEVRIKEGATISFS